MSAATHERFAVVGLGCVLPGAPDVDTFWDNVTTGVDSTSAVPDDRIDPTLLAGLEEVGVGHRGGFVPAGALEFDPASFGIMPVAVAGTEPDQLLALRTAAEALADVGDLAGVDRSRVGVVLGRGGYLTPGVARLDQRVRTVPQLEATLRDLLPELDDARIADVTGAFLDRLGEHHPESSIGLVPNLVASRTANRLDLGGPAYTVDAACASALVALDSGLAELRSGRCDLVLVGGVHHCHDITLWSVFDQLGALSPSGRIRPFSRHADGIVIGEGTAILAIERLEDAERNGHEVYATIAGAGLASDGRDASLMSPRVEGQVLALERAYASSGVDPAAVGLVEGHGTATSAGDRAELDTIRRVFGKHEEDGPRSVLGSVKSMIGHAMPAAGAAGLLKAVLAVHHGVLPPTLGAEEPHPALADTGMRTLARAEPWEERVRVAGINAFGFGGINGHVVVESHGEPARSRRRKAPPVSEVHALVLAAPDGDGILAQLDAVAERIGRGEPPVLPRTAPVGGPARLAIVDPDPKRIELARRLVTKGRPWRGRNDIWFTTDPLLEDGAGVAFLFPGVEPSSDTKLEGVAAHFGRDLPAVPDGSTELESKGFQIFAAGRLLHGVLADLGIAPDVVAGHSLGEWTGMFASEMIPPAEADDFLAGLAVGSLEVPGVAYLALGCGVDVASELVEGIADAAISHDNCPHQSVVVGTPEAIAAVRERMGARKVMGQEMPFRSGFHSRWLEPYLGVVHQQWDRLPLQPPVVPMWSATTCAPYPSDPAAVRELAFRHLLEPVRFRELAGRLHDEGVRAFVQLGVGSTVGFVEDTLRDREHLAVSAHSGKHDGLEQLARVALALWVEGAEPDLSRLSRGHGPRLGGVRLELGVPLVRFDEPPSPSGPTVPAHVDPAFTSLDPASPPAAASADDPFAALHATLVAEALDASREVLEAFAGSSRQVPDSVEHVRRIDLESSPWLVDHAFYRQPDGWPDEDRFPVVPMTGMVEMLIGVASELEPGRTAVEVTSVRALRWLPVAPPMDVTLKARRRGDGTIEASIDGYARGVVRFADAHPPAPAPSAAPLGDPRPSPLPVEDIYSRHFLFHGPQFQGVRSVDAMGRDGADGVVRVCRAPGATLDAAGQIYGWWVMESAASNFLALPSTIERIEYFGDPPVGTDLACTARIVAMDERTVEADLELVEGGSTVVRITGWVDRRFDSTPELWDMLRDPEDLIVSHLLTDRVAVTFEGWPDSASRELIARRYLDRDERAVYEALNPRAQRHHVLGRIAAKDALRWRAWNAGVGAMFPVEHRMRNDPHGRPVVDGGGPPVSVAHTSWVGAAIVGDRDGPPVGIDVEVVEDRDEVAVSSFASLDELALSGSDPVSVTRLWCAKEAAGKAAGTGLAGRPRELVLTAVDGDRFRIGDRWVSTVGIRVPDALASGIRRDRPVDLPSLRLPATDLSKTDLSTNDRTTQEQITHVVAYTDPDR